MSVQPTLLDLAERIERPRKTVRKVSREQYKVLRDGTRLTARAHAVLTALAHYYNVRQDWPTAGELTRWMFEHGKIPRESANLVAPRLTGLVSGETTERKGQIVRVGGNTCELLPKRRCSVTGGLAHPVRIREAGSLPDPFGYGGKT